MTTKGYTVLGWFAWQLMSRIVKDKLGQNLGQNKVKIGAAATVFAVIAAGILAARASSGDD